MKLKAGLSGGSVLHSPDNGHEFAVQTDASDQGMGQCCVKWMRTRRSIP